MSSSTAPVSYTDPSLEPPISNESSLVDSVISSINSIQSRNFSHHRHGFRGTHVKTQAILKGTLEIPSSLPPHLAQGLFSHAGTYPLALRFANEPSFLKDDRAPGPRGLGVKVFNIPSAAGGFLDPIGEQTKTQDFTFNNAPVLELRDLPTTAEILALREKYFDDPERLEKELNKRKDKDLQFAPAGLPNNHFLAYTMYSQSAYRYGDYVVKYALFPVGDQASLAESHKVTDDSSREQHSEWIKDWTSSHPTEYEFRVQLCRNAKDQPVEDCAVEWDEEKYPFETVGKVHLPPQDSWIDERRAFWDERMKLNVWYGLEAHRPMGSSNRLRRELYKASQRKRETINATELKTVSSIDEIP